MNILSLFDGISCGRVALERSGITINNYFASEIDNSAITITQTNHPNTIQLGDVNNWQSWNLPKIDLILAGSPCQGFSIGGKGLNFDDPRSALFFTFIDILEYYKPKYFLLENVKMRPNWSNIISDFVGCTPKYINSSDFSAQDRKRLYWTNIPILPIGSSNDIVEDILEPEVDTKYLIKPNRAVVILDNEVKRRKIGYIGIDAQGNRIYSIHNKSITLCGQAGGLGAKTGIYALPCLTPDRTEKRQNGRRFKPPQSKFYTLTAQDQYGVLTNHFIRKLTPIECERLQTLPDNYTQGVSDNQRYKVLGNGWTVDVIAHILKGI